MRRSFGDAEVSAAPEFQRRRSFGGAGVSAALESACRQDSAAPEFRMRRIGGCWPAHALRQSVSCEHPRVRGRRPRRGPPPTRNLESWTMARGRRGATRRATPSSCRCHCGTADRASEDPDLRKGPVALQLGRPRCARGRLRAWRGLTRIRSSTRERPKRDSETIGDGETARRRTRWASWGARPAAGAAFFAATAALVLTAGMTISFG